MLMLCAKANILLVYCRCQAAYGARFLEYIQHQSRCISRVVSKPAHTVHGFLVNCTDSSEYFQEFVQSWTNTPAPVVPLLASSGAHYNGPRVRHAKAGTVRACGSAYASLRMKVDLAGRMSLVIECLKMHVCVYVHACVCACARACVYVYMRFYLLRARVCVHCARARMGLYIRVKCLRPECLSHPSASHQVPGSACQQHYAARRNDPTQLMQQDNLVCHHAVACVVTPLSCR